MLLHGLYVWLCHQYRPTPVYKISKFVTLNYHISQARLSSTQSLPQAGYASTVEIDSHADTFVAGRNCVPLNYTDRTCDVQPYSDDYAPVTNVPIITAATGYTSAAGHQYILVFPEAIYMPTLAHSLCNPNQLRHFGTKVQDNPYAGVPMGLSTSDNTFTACFQSKGTDIYLNTWTPSPSDLESYPHIVLCSPQLWDPRAVKFPGTSIHEQEEIEVRNVMAIKAIDENEEDHQENENDVLFNINQIRTRIVSSAKITTEDLNHFRKQRRIKETRTTTLPPAPDMMSGPIFPGPLEDQEIQPPKIFLSNERHSRTTPEDLSERWGLSIAPVSYTHLTLPTN